MDDEVEADLSQIQLPAQTTRWQRTPLLNTYNKRRTIHHLHLHYSRLSTNPIPKYNSSTIDQSNE